MRAPQCTSSTRSAFLFDRCESVIVLEVRIDVDRMVNLNDDCILN
jgi:hypothetical protein